MKPDIIMQWCVFNDYPIFRRNINKYRDKINKVIIYPSRHHGFIDLEDHAKEVFKETWVDPVEINFSEEDWRQAETTPCLKHIESDWIWFTEQDFFVDNWDKFYNDVEELKNKADMFGWWHESKFSYMHPCCLFVKRELFIDMNKDFSAHPEIEGCDHFAMITRDAERLGGKIIKLQDIGYKNWENAFHLAGLTYPYQNWSKDRVFGVGNVDAFYVYNYWSRLMPGVSDDYIKLSYEVEDYMKRNVTYVDPLLSRWRTFFDEEFD